MTSWMRTIRGTFQSALTAYQMTLMLHSLCQHQATVAERKPTFSKVFMKGCVMFFSVEKNVVLSVDCDGSLILRDPEAVNVVQLIPFYTISFSQHLRGKY